eukprot:403345836
MRGHKKPDDKDSQSNQPMPQYVNLLADLRDSYPESIRNSIPVDELMEDYESQFTFKGLMNRKIKRQDIPKIAAEQVSRGDYNNQSDSRLYQTQINSAQSPISIDLDNLPKKLQPQVGRKRRKSSMSQVSQFENASQDDDSLQILEVSSQPQKRVRINLDEEVKISHVSSNKSQSSQQSQKSAKSRVSVTLNCKRDEKQQNLFRKSTSQSRESSQNSRQSSNEVASQLTNFDLSEEVEVLETEPIVFPIFGEYISKLNGRHADMILYGGVIVRQGIMHFCSEDEFEESKINRRRMRIAKAFDIDYKTQAFIDMMKTSKSSTIRPCPYDVICIEDNECIEIKSSQDSRTSSQNDDVQITHTNFSNNQRGRKPLFRFFSAHIKPTKCKNCGECGHTRSQCKEPLRELDTLCLYCRQKGLHLDLNCDLKPKSCNICLELGHRRDKCPSYIYDQDESEVQYFPNSLIYSSRGKEPSQYQKKWDSFYYECMKCRQIGDSCKCSQTKTQALQLKTDLIVQQRFDSHTEHAENLRKSSLLDYETFKIKDYTINPLDKYGVTFPQARDSKGNKNGTSDSDEEVMVIDSHHLLKEKQNSSDQGRQNTRDEVNEMLVPKDHNCMTVYCFGCGGQNHFYDNCPDYLQRRDNNEGPSQKGSFSIPMSYKLTSYSGSNPNKDAKRARKFEQAQRRICEINSNPEILNKLCGSSDLSSQKSTPPQNSSDSQNTACTDSNKNTPQVIEVQKEHNQVQPILNIQTTSNMNGLIDDPRSLRFPQKADKSKELVEREQKLTSMWGNSFKQDDQNAIEISLKNRMALKNWKI